MKDVVIVSAARTAVGSYLGSLKSVEAAELGKLAIAAALERAGVAARDVDQVIMGDVYSMTPNLARISALLAGIPESVPAFTVDRQCASSLQALYSGCLEIISGESDVVVAGGAESMSRYVYYLPPEARIEGLKFGNKQLLDRFSVGVTEVQPPELYPNLNMGLTAENIAERYEITREQQDSFAYDSQRKTSEAQAAGKFKDEIIPVTINNKKNSFVFDQDEHLRPETTLETLSKLKPAFKHDGTVTAGNSSGMNDGASAVVIMSRDKAKELGCTPLVKVLCFSAVALDPAVMGLGPVYAIRKLLKKSHLQLDDIDLFEINEAFAAQSLGCLKELGMMPGTALHKRINVNGGAIAHGHALANSGTRILTTLIYELKRRNGKYGIATLCIGGGQGMAVLIKNESV